MATFNDSDLILVGRAGGSFRATAQDLKTYVESGDGLVYRGAIDFTAAPGGQLDPAVPTVGDLYINTTAGTVNAGFAGAAGSTTAVGDRMLWDGTEWDLVESSQDVGVTGVNVTAPITDTGTPAEPSIGISDATNAAKGAVQLANDPGNSGDLTTDTANDVLIKSHFDELNRRIGVAAGGGVTSVGGDAPIQTTTAGSDVTVSIADATTAAPGAVQLQDTVDTSSTRAATPKAINDYAVPLDLSSLTELGS